MFQIRKLLANGEEGLDERGREQILAGIRVGNIEEAAERLGNAITTCLEDEVPEIRTMGRTLSHWRTKILTHYSTGASNGPTAAANF